METMVLLVFLAIVWAGVGLYWLKTRGAATPAALGRNSRRGSSLDATMSKRSASVLPLRGLGPSVDVMPSRAARRQVPAGVPAHPGHSLTQPATHGDRTTRPVPTITSDQARRRRRALLLTLFALAALTLVGAATIGGTALILAHLAADALLLGFILLLVQYQREIELDRTRNLPVYAEPPSTLVATGTDGR